VTGVVTAAVVREHVAEFVADVVDGLDHPRQREHAETYVRGLIGDGRRKSLQPTLFRLGACGLVGVDAGYQSVQQFLADSPWDPQLVIRACAERVAPQLEVAAWVVDDTGFAKDGRRSPGVQRQYSGTLGKIGNCQIGVSVHAVGGHGTLPLGWRLYLPASWCEDAEARRRAKIPERVVFQTKPQLAAELVAAARGWDVPQAPILADQAYGDDTLFRERLDGDGATYVVAVKPTTSVYPPLTVFAVPARDGLIGRPPSVARADRRPLAVAEIAATLPAAAWQTIPCRTTPQGVVQTSRFALVRVWAAHTILRHHKAPRSEWLIIEWPEGADTPSDYWLSNLAASTIPEQLARLARLRWTIELDYRQLKGELGLDHYEGRSWKGWHHHTALVTCAHAFLTEQRLRPRPPRPA
jgi:SRSO17 transposase